MQYLLELCPLRSLRISFFFSSEFELGNSCESARENERRKRGKKIYAFLLAWILYKAANINIINRKAEQKKTNIQNMRHIC